MDVYIAQYLSQILGVSARLQGAELIRANWIDGMVAQGADRTILEATAKVSNYDVQDMED